MMTAFDSRRIGDLDRECLTAVVTGEQRVGALRGNPIPVGDLGEIGKARLRERPSKRFPGGGERRVQRAGRLEGTGPVSERARRRRERALAGLDDLEQADLGRGSDEAEAAIGPERRDGEAGVGPGRRGSARRRCGGSPSRRRPGAPSSACPTCSARPGRSPPAARRRPLGERQVHDMSVAPHLTLGRGPSRGPPRSSTLLA